MPQQLDLPEYPLCVNEIVKGVGDPFDRDISARYRVDSRANHAIAAIPDSLQVRVPRINCKVVVADRDSVEGPLKRFHRRHDSS